MPSIEKSHIDAVRALADVTSVEYEEPLLTVELISGASLSIQVPENYPRGSAEFFSEDASGPLLPGVLSDLVSQAIHQVYSRCNDGLGERQDSYGVERTASSGMVGYDEEDMFSPSRQDSSSCAEIDSDVNSLRSYPKVTNVVMKSIGGYTYVKWSMTVNDLLSVTTASAWGIANDAPIEVTLKVSAHYYDSMKPPSVEFYQKDKKFPFGQQMSRILNTHLALYWPRKFPTKVHDPSVTGPSSVCAADVPLQPAQRAVCDALVEMGYEALRAKHAALHATTVDRAITFLEEDKGQATFTPTNVYDSQKLQGLVSDPSKTQYDASKDPNKMVSFDVRRGLLCHVVDVIRKRSTSVSQYCVLCDQPHLFANNMLRPAVCAREMCVYQFQDLKLGSDSAESIATDAGVVDLLLTIFRCAALSPRAQNILLPFPSVSDPKNPKKLALDPAKPDFTVVKRVLQQFPTTKDIVRSGDLAQLKERLQATEPLAYPLFEWVIASNRSHLIQMDQRCLIPAMGTSHQYLLLTAAPEKEAIFREKKAKHGTKFAFHGSKAENWHGILRNGLKNMSGTTNQVNGAAHGKGIYFAQQCGTSIGYSGTVTTQASKDDTFLGEGMLCVALCEIVDDGCIKEHGWCWTVEEEMNVMTRFFFVYTATPPPSASGTSTADDAFLASVKAAMGFYSLS